MSDDRPPEPASPWSTPTDGAPLPYGQGGAPPPPPPYGAAPPPGPYGQPQDLPGPPPAPVYGQPVYGGPPAPGGYGVDPRVAKARSSATLWLILNIVSVLFCSNLPGIVGAVYAGLALGRVDVDPADAERKTRLARIWFFAGLVLVLVLAVVAVIALVAFGVLSDTSSSSVPATGV